MARIVLRDLLKRYPNGTTALEEADLVVEDGEYLVVAGPHRSGVSTLLRVAAGVEKPTAGGVRKGEQSVIARGEPGPARVFENFALYPHLTVRDNLAFALKLASVPSAEIDQRVAKVARELDLERYLEHKPAQLSEGFRARVSLGRAIVRDPQLVILDEPVRGIRASPPEVRAELKRVRSLGLTTLHATHDPVEALELGDRVAVISGGRIQQVGRPEAIRSEPANLAVADFLSGGEANLLHGTWDGEKLALPAGDFTLPGEAAERYAGARRGRVIVAVTPRAGWERASVRAPEVGADPGSAIPFDRVSPDLEAALGERAPARGRRFLRRPLFGGRPRRAEPAPLPAEPTGIRLFDADTGVNLASEPTEPAEARRPSEVSGRTVVELVAETPAPRYVNVALSDPESGTVVPQSHRIEPATSFNLRVDIGSLSRDSVVDNAEAYPVPDHLLPQSSTGHWLDVVAASERFEVIPARHGLFLPLSGPAWVCDCPTEVHSCTPAERRPYLRIPVVTPKDPGPAAIRLAVYHQQHVVQSQLFDALVGLEPEPVGHRSTIDYSLTAHLSDVGALPARTVSVLVNETADGGHRLLVNGRDSDPFLFTVSDGEMRNHSGAARQTLLSAHFVMRGEDTTKWKTRYDDRNAKKSKTDLIEDLTALARAGWRLLTLLFPDPGALRGLRQMLSAETERHRGGAVIQIAQAGRSQVVLPWALAYDIPIPSGADRSLEPCQFLKDWEIGTGELPDLCPYGDQHREGTVCPFGFWGVAHVIEVPPAPAQGDSLARWVMERDPQRRVVLGRSHELKEEFSRDHLDSLRDELHLEVDDRGSYESVGEGLASSDLEIAYFYCHGKREEVPGSEEPLPVLEVGQSDRIRPEDLQYWAQSKWPADHWAKVRPLVVINGCHTAELTPDLLGNFVRAFAGARASGVIGTEVSITQRVANEAVEQFLEGLYRPRATVGAALQAMRRRLLSKGNVMGLAYTPYCSASLTLRRGTK